MLYTDTEGIPLDLINNFSFENLLIYSFIKLHFYLKCLYHGWGFFHIYNIWNTMISCRSRILSSWTFWLLKLTEVTSNQESVLQ